MEALRRGCELGTRRGLAPLQRGRAALLVAAALGAAFASEAGAELCARGSFLRWREECREKEVPVPCAPFWVDATGAPVGAYEGGGLIHRDAEGRVFRFEVDRATGRIPRFENPTVFAFFEGRDCRGTPLLPENADVVRRAFVLADRPDVGFAAPDSESPTLVRSHWDDVFWTCVNREQTAWVGAPITFPFEVVEPLRVR